MVVTWNKNGTRLLVLDTYQKGDETWFTVCKETAASNAVMGRFGVRAVDMWEAAGHLGMTTRMLEDVYAKHHPDWQKRAADV